MRLDIAHKVGAENQTSANLLLHADIHIYRTGRAEIRSVNTHPAQFDSKPLLKKRSDIVRIRCIRIKWIVGLILLLERNDLTGHITYGDWVICEHTADGRAAKSWLQCSSGDGYWQRRCRASTGGGRLCKDVARCESVKGIVWRHCRKDIFVEKADATPN